MLTRSLSRLMLDSPTTRRMMVSRDTKPFSEPSLQPNHLVLIPDEVLSHIISFLSMADIGVLCLTGSSILMNRVVAWIATISCSKKVIRTLAMELLDCQLGCDEWIATCKQFGVLCKRASMLSSTSTRLRLLTNGTLS